MAVEVITWVFSHSRSRNGERLVMLAIADACNNADGTGAWLSNAALCAKTNLSERAVQTAVKGCELLGELKVERNAGRGGVNRFIVVTGEKVQNLRGAESAGARTDEASQASTAKGAESAGKAGSGKGAESAPGTVTTKNSSTKSSNHRTRKPKAKAEIRPDVIEISTYLADMIERQGSKRPDFRNNASWLRDARLLLDEIRPIPVDVERIRLAVEWVEQHHFWHKVIQSMTNLRKNWDKIRLDATAEAKLARDKQAGRFAGGMRPESNAPKVIPLDDKCQDHPGHRKSTCVVCRDEALASADR